jgi:glycerol-3-phosphate acyltransferase PlsY
MELIILGLCLTAYLLGSMPSAVWVGKAFHGIDIREHGSGNAGATNTFRILGKKTGFWVLFLDSLKGITAASLVHFLGNIEPGTERFVNLQLLFGLMAVFGHLFPVFAGFKGGKGIATLLGMVIGIHYLLAIACFGMFMLVLVLTRYVSLSSILATLAFPLLATFVFHQYEPMLLAFGICASLIVLLTHQKNIKKLINGEENKAKLFRRINN